MQTKYLFAKNFALVVLFIISPFAYAEEPMADSQSIYQVEVPVKDRSDQTLAESLPRAFAEVLIQVSDNPEVVNTEHVKKLLPKAQDYITQYRYQGTNLLVQFSQPGVDEILRRAKSSPAVQKPKELVFWLNVGDELLSANHEDQAVHSEIVAQAKKFNIPMLLPVMDLEESEKITALQIDAFSPDVVDYTGKRYGTQNVVMGFVKQDDQGMWEGQWSLHWQNDEHTGSSQGLSSEQVLADMMEMVGSYLKQTQRQEITANKASVTKVYIKGVNGLEDFGEVVDYIRRLPTVQQVVVENVFTDAISLRVSHLGDEDHLDQILRTKDVLTTMPGDERMDDILTYHWGHTWEDS